ncbi:MAG: Uma2 family endonuclease [Luteitalea sp.]|nr:Uma2 family endonuclease [Luteitalea sp.]
MATVLSAAEQRVLLQNIPWEVYEGLLATQQDASVPRYTYDEGLLEIMSPSAEHEHANDVIRLLVNVAAEEMAIDVAGFGSTTYRRKDLARGFEPDASFYVTHVKQVRGRATLDLTTDPPPDLVVEIDVTKSSLDKLAIFARFGIREAWRYDGTRLTVFVLVAGQYVERQASDVFPGLAAETLTRFIGEARELERPVWLHRLRAWIRSHRV